MSEKLEIVKGGRLISTRWKFDEAADKGDYVSYDVSDRIQGFWYDRCTLAEDVTLRDVFVLIQPNILSVGPIMSNWAEEIFSEGLSGKPFNRDSEIHYLELYWRIELLGGELSGREYPCFHGQGTYEGKPCPLGVEMAPAYELIDYPLRLRPETKIFDEDNKEVLTCWIPMSLGQILYGIIWELSFFGSPEMRDQAGLEIRESIKRSKDEPEILMSMEELFDEVK